MSNSVPSKSNDATLQSKTDSWNKRYREEGEIWGRNPSAVARTLVNNLHPASRVLEIGFGYGRDLKPLLEHGHTLTGVERSTVGLDMAARNLENYFEGGQLHLILGDFIKASLSQNFYDAAYSHRTIHLVPPDRIDPFIHRIAGAIRPAALTIISARNPEDFDKSKMEILEKNKRHQVITASYKDRPGHIINFWDEDKFRKKFENHFYISEFRRITEMESISNPDTQSSITVMIAYKKSPSFALNSASRKRKSFTRNNRDNNSNLALYDFIPAIT